jgi:wobble nucleotide-excising tRNase
MINRVNLLRNIGKFDSVQTGANITLGRCVLIYAENGRGKTTLTAILRSLASGDPIPIVERHRLAAQNPPHVIFDCIGGPPPAIFHDNAWNRTLANIMIFDDVFVDQNVCSGLAIESDHRQNPHELILGAEGVTLNQQLQHLVDQIEIHNNSLRTKGEAIPAAERGNLSVEEFCALPARADIDDAIQATERALAAAREQDSVRQTPTFNPLSLPAFDVAAIGEVLRQDLPGLGSAAADRVQEHLVAIGRNAEPWVAEGMSKVQIAGGQVRNPTCPFCAQDLSGSPVIGHYRAYFSDAYAALKRNVADFLTTVNLVHSGENQAAFERAVRIASERRLFWSRFCEVPAINFETDLISRDWIAARDAVVAALTAKRGAPLEPIAFGTEAHDAFARYEFRRASVATINRQLQEVNASISVVKEQAAGANDATLATDLVRLRAVESRHEPAIAVLCHAYLAEKIDKGHTEQRRDQARTALDQYRANAFPGFETAINVYLRRFNAGFRLDSISPANTRGGPSCTYNVVINNIQVPVAVGDDVPGQPSFRNTMSSGDRNTLALAFFFASLDRDPNGADKIVVIDDPISSLDEQRSLTTVQELRRVAQRVSQLIILSHNKPFLCRVWQGIDPTLQTALKIERDANGSTIAVWDVDEDSVTEHDRRHALLRTFLLNGPNNDSREVARAMRPVLEAFLRITCPEHFRPGTMLGTFRGLCEQNCGTSREILNAQDTQELHDLVEYANRFHHDTNPAFETGHINDSELRGFVERTLRFARR